MELEDLRRLWQELDRKLDASLRLDERILAEAVVSRAQAASRRSGRGILVEIVLGAIPVLWLGSFLADHIREPRFWIAAAVLDVFAVASLASLLRQQALLRGIDWSGPVAGIQRAIAEIRVRRVRVTKWTLMLAPLVWTPMLVVALRGFLGVDVYHAFEGAGLFLAANLLFGLAFLAAAVWASRRFSERLHRVPFVRRLLRDLGGRSLGEAEGVVASIHRFAEPGVEDSASRASEV
jgi:hypothetical protein